MNIPQWPPIPFLKPALIPVLKPAVDGDAFKNINSHLNFLYEPDPVLLNPASKVSFGEDSSKEIRSKRTPTSKTYDLGDGQYKLITSPVIIHYFEEGEYKEIDLRINDVGGVKEMTKAPYKIEIFTDRIGYKLKHSDGSYFTIELVGLGGAPVDNSRLVSTVNGCQMFWDGLYPDLSMKVLLLPGRPEIFTRICSAEAPKVFIWKVVQQGCFEFSSFGADCNGDSLEVLVRRQSVNGTEFYYIEEWTGRVSRKEKKTRIKKWYDDPVYPVVIDPTVTINTTTNNDDGYEFNTLGAGYWHLNIIWMGRGGGGFTFTFNSTFYNGGFRFQNVGIPSGATVSSATLKVRVKAGGSGSPSIKVYADKVGNAAAWSNASLPSQITLSVATLWSPTRSALNSIDVKSQVASVVALGGWASNNAIRFGALGFNPNGAKVSAYDYSTSVPNAASLVVVYSVGGGGNPRHGDMNFMGI